MEMEKETEQKIYTFLQLRLHPAIVVLKEKIAAAYRLEKIRY
jgi:predicted dehydrogenase